MEGQTTKTSGVKPKKKLKPSTAVVTVEDVAAPVADDEVEEQDVSATRKPRNDKGKPRMKIKRVKKEKGVRKVKVNGQWKSIENVSCLVVLCILLLSFRWAPKLRQLLMHCLMGGMMTWSIWKVKERDWTLMMMISKSRFCF